MSLTPSALPLPRSPTGLSAEQQRASLRRLLGLRERATRSPGILPPKSLDRRIDGVEIAPGLFFYEQHVAWPLLEFADDALSFESNALTPANLLLFDTETTGLAGGTGTRAFMIGAADWQGGALRVRQLTLATMGAEPLMLAEFARWLRPEHHLVSYNGRCYDAPLLTTRYRLARMDNPLQALAHLDLLHPVRRRYRGRWENCRMATIERHLLGIVREHDLPGAEAPLAWRTYLSGGSAATLRRVGEHNLQDLKSLAALLLRLCADDSPLEFELRGGQTGAASPPFAPSTQLPRAGWTLPIGRKRASLAQ